MPRYVAMEKVWLSHENRFAEAGEEFETIFPSVIQDANGKTIVTRDPKLAKKGKPMALGERIRLVGKTKPDDEKPDDEKPGDDSLV